MDVVFPHGAGLEVPKKRVMACRITPDPTGQQAEGRVAVQAWGTRTVDRRALADGLAAAGITQVAMASPGESWKPVCHRREGIVPGFWVTARQVTRVPGRKTATADARWLARLRRDGVRHASGRPPAGQRDGRERTRDRTTLGPERRREVNRGPGGLAPATINLASVATDSLGVSGRASWAAVVEGRADPATMAALAQRRLRRQMPLRAQALTGLVRAQPRRWVALPWAQSAFLDAPMEALRGEMTRGLTAWSAAEVLPPPSASSAAADGAAAPAVPGAPLTLTRALTRLETIPGVDRRGAERGVAEPGSDRARVGTAARLAAWGGGAPGTDERAGQPRSGRTRPGTQPRRPVLTPLAPAAAHTQGTSRSARSQR